MSLRNVQRVENLPDGHHLKYLNDGRVFLCSPYCTDVTEFANTYIEVLEQTPIFRKKLAEIANISDEAERLSKLNKLEDLARSKRVQLDQARISKLNEGIAELDADITSGKVVVDPADLTWLNADPRRKELAFDFATKRYKIQEAKIALEAEKAGVLKAPVRRPADIDPDIIDGNGFGWDVKSYEPGSTPEAIAADLLKYAKGEDILADLTGLSVADRTKVESLVKAGLGSDHKQIKFAFV